MGFSSSENSGYAQRAAARLQRRRQCRVIIRRCATPDDDRLRGVIAESLDELGLRVGAKTLIKPNIVTANRRYIHHSFTDPRVVAAAVNWSRDRGAERVTIGESGGFGIPSRLFFREAGYDPRRFPGAELVDFNLEPTVEIPLARGVHHRALRLARSLHDADFYLWAPKLKYHICCTITCALKLNVGILTHAERMLFHDDRLDEKIVDLLEAGYPDAVVADAIEIGTGFESAPRPFHLGVVLVADDPVAMDIVACRILGFEPHECRHLALALERGYGPPNVDAVRVEGDVALDELRAATRGIESEYQDIHKVKTPIRFYCGTDPTRGRLCHGGCLAAVKGALGTIDKRRPGSVAAARGGAIVTGVYRGDVDAGDGVALLVGDCTRVEGAVRARKIVRAKGCPIGAKQLFTVIPRHFRMPNPMLDLRDAWLFVAYSIDKFFRRIALR
jgi:uncharacterized protein (DUF362 family)